MGQRSSGTSRVVLVSSLVVALARCGAPSAAPPSGAATARDVRVAAPFDLDAVVRQVRLAFRPADDGWSGGHATYAVRARADGAAALTVTPFHQPTARGPALEGAPVTFAVTALGRGEGAPAVAAVAGHVAADGHLELARGAAREALRNTEAGVAQSWTLDRRPAGAGALTVRLAVAGADYAGATAHGLHFRDARTGLGVRYGHGTWIDARGARTPVPAAYEDGAVVLRVGADVVEASAYPAVLDPVVSPEFGLDRPVYVPAAASSAPVMASNGAVYLVAWEERGVIVGTRVTAGGAVLDPAGLAIMTRAVLPSLTMPRHLRPAVASNGLDFLVTWVTVGNTDVGNRWCVRAGRFTAAGAALDPDGFGVSGCRSPAVVAQAVASNGADYLVVWNDPAGGDYVKGARVGADGTLLNAAPLTILSRAGSPQALAAASDGRGYLVASAGSGGAYGAVVSAEGVAGLPASLTPAPWNATVALAWGGRDYLAVWSERRGATGEDVYATRVSPAGEARDPAGLAVTATAGDQYDPAVAWDGARFQVFWSDARDSTTCDPCALTPTCDCAACAPMPCRVPTSEALYGGRVTADGVALDPGGIVLTTGPTHDVAPVAAAAGGTVLVAWRHDDDASSSILGARVDGAGRPRGRTGFVVAMSHNAQSRPAVASDGDSYLVVWQDDRSARPGGPPPSLDIFGARVGGDGAVLDPAGLAISTARGDQSAPAVTFNGRDYLVVWQDDRSGWSTDIYGARVTLGGHVRDTRGIAIAKAHGDQRAPAVARELVVWTDGRHAGDPCDPCALDPDGCDPCRCNAACDVDAGVAAEVFGARVTPAGVVRDRGGFPISALGVRATAPSVAHDGRGYLVAWGTARSTRFETSAVDLVATRVDADGVVLDRPPTAIAGFSYSPPTAAWGGGTYLVAWDASTRESAPLPVIQAVRVGVDGAVRDAAPRVVGASQTSRASFPRAAFDGAAFLVVWQTAGAFDHIARYTGANVRAGRLSVAGEALDGDGFAISTDGVPERLPVVASTGDGRALVAYERGAYGVSEHAPGDLVSTGALRVRARLVTPDAPP